MTIDTPAHLLSIFSPYPLHRFDWSVTFLTLHRRSHMTAVIEIDEICQIMNIDPFNRLASVPVPFELGDFGFDVPFTIL